MNGSLYIKFIYYCKEKLASHHNNKKIDVMESKAFLYIKFIYYCKEKLASHHNNKKIENIIYYVVYLLHDIINMGNMGNALSLSTEYCNICIKMLQAEKQGLIKLDDETKKSFNEIVNALAKSIKENKDNIVELIENGLEEEED